MKTLNISQKILGLFSLSIGAFLVIVILAKNGKLNETSAEAAELVVACLSPAVLFFIFRLFNHTFRRLTRDVSEITKDLHGTSQTLNNSASELARSQQSQSSALEQTAASLNEISNMAESNKKTAEAVDKNVHEAHSICQNTQASMDQLSGAMRAILDSNARIEKLVGTIREIGDKAEIIDEIVFKTQILSFNASVEAERAGEHGRGFAVVAAEIGNLAKMSGEAALEIAAILKKSLSEATQVSTENKTRVTTGRQLAERTKTETGIVLEKLTGISQSTGKIVDASREQVLGINQISLAVESINKNGQHATLVADETSSSSTSLMRISEALSSTGSHINELIFGKSTLVSEKTNRSSRRPSATPKSKILNFSNKKSSQIKRDEAHIESLKAAVGSTEHSQKIKAWEKL